MLLKLPLTQINNKIMMIFVATIFFVAPFFVALKYLRWQLISKSHSDQLILWIKPLWPVAFDQYKSIGLIDALDASNFTVFWAVSLAAFAITFVYALYCYCTGTEYVRVSGALVVWYCLFTLACYLFLAWFDVPSGHKARLSFTVDGIGIYYFRDYTFFFMAGSLIQMSALYLLNFLTRILRQAKP